MAALHAAPLIALALLAAPARPLVPAVTLSLGREKGVVVVRNRTSSEQWLARALAVEWRWKGAWRPLSIINLRLVAECDLSTAPRLHPVRLRPRQVVPVQPWTGEDCAAQCAQSCRLNRYVGPGIFRIVARTWPGGAPIYSPAFSMPATPPARREYGGPMDYRAMIEASKWPRPGPNEP